MLPFNGDLNDKRTVVRTQVVLDDGKLVSIDYAFRKSRSGDWKAYDVIIEGDSSGEFVQREPADPAAWEAAGATWWIESWWTVKRGEAGLAELRRRIEAGPPG